MNRTDMADTLPPLPDLPVPLSAIYWQHNMFTADQTREYAKDYARAALAAVPAQPVETFESWQQGFDAGYQQGIAAKQYITHLESLVAAYKAAQPVQQAAAERERWATAARLVVEATPEQLPPALDALADVLRA